MKTKFTDISIDLITTKEAIDICMDYLEDEHVNTIYFLNAHCYNISKKNKIYKEAINKSQLLLNDGIGVKMGLRVHGIKEKENMNGTDFIPNIINLANKYKKNIYLLGGKPGIAELAKDNIIAKYNSCNIVGVSDGYFDSDKNDYIVNDIVSKKTDILIVGMGVPTQELWIENNREKLEGVKIAIAGGAILDFMSGEIKRAPRFVRKFKAEWIYRLYLEPKRLFRRYIIGNFEFFYYIIKSKIVNK